MSTIRTEEELEERLSRPNPADVEFMRRLEGDLLILGVAGKMGPSLARRARRAADEAGVRMRVVGVARFSNPRVREELEAAGVETIGADLLDDDQLRALPDFPNVIYMAARKFGTTGNECLTWALNTYLPGRVAERFRRSRIVAFSSGNVYPLVPVAQGGPTEATPPDPVGEYAQSVLGRERMFEYFSARYGTPVALLRLNYAIDLRYGVLVDIARRVYERRPVQLAMGMVNVIWQGDANSVALRALGLCETPPAVLNVTGPETVSVRSLARRFGERFGVEPIFEGTEAPTALLSDASRCHRLFGYPEVSLEQMIEWVADWIRSGGALWDKPTHFEVRDGKF
ncbi:MAG: NAD(P)-dependent oxidoreductase [Bryobacterales bacterium]|nr:NAD(P)-dependent oxidoreductase [Bryobacteraceae bacterium]MDW8130958.1 NAD(P)-dependent oxidoreductase [Bryobacterales bacterium]